MVCLTVNKDLFIIESNCAASESFEYTSQVIRIKFYATFMSFLELESFGSQWLFNGGEKNPAEQDSKHQLLNSERKGDTSLEWEQHFSNLLSL